MARKSLNAIKSWMSSRLAQYMDACGELDITKLAEDAIVQFNVGGEDEDEVFEISATFC